MVSPELLRRYPFFSGLTHQHLVQLARVATEEHVPKGHVFFRDGEAITAFYLVIDGAISIDLSVTDTSSEPPVSQQLLGEIQTKTVSVSTVGSGGIFGWSALIPPTITSAGARAVTPCRIITFDCEALLPNFDSECQFGYLMVQKAAQVIRERMRDLRVESLAFAPQ